MLKNKILTLAAALVFSLPAMAQNGSEQQQPSPEEMIQQEVERLERGLKLEYWQVFYVDSTLRHNYEGMMKEMEVLKRSRVENSDIYYSVQDKWISATQDAYKKFFTEEQWKNYLSQGGYKIIKEREKRQKKVAEATSDAQVKSEKQNKKKSKK